VGTIDDIVRNREKLEESLKPLREIQEAADRHAELIRSGIQDRFDVRSRHEMFENQFESLARAHAEAAEAPTARRAVTRILGEIRSFQSELDNSLDVALQLISLPHYVIQVDQVGFYQPNLIVLYGRIDGRATRLVQHLSQLSFLLTSVKRQNPDEPRRQIGFHVATDESESEAEQGRLDLIPRPETHRTWPSLVCARSAVTDS
jgi:hypothetical protein